MMSYDSPPLSPCRGHYVPCKVFMLDDTVLTFDILPKSLGRVLFDAVVGKLQLLEYDYFDLEYLDQESVPCWLDHGKPIIKQINMPELVFRFLVKFYTPDPELLEEELTRYLFALQIKRDLVNGSLFCQEHTAVLLASFIVQAEVGDYCDELVEQGYMSTLRVLPNQTPELEYKIMEHHREHIGQMPAEADFNLLDTARKVEVYGIRMHQAKDHEGITLQLAVTHGGLVVFQNFTKLNSFSWAKIRKLCFKRKKFIIKLHADGSLYSKDSVEFYFLSRNWSKNFWKRCIEYHAFFRCHSAQHNSKRCRPRSRMVSRGSSFRYSGRTQKELMEFVRENYVTPAPFQRSSSMRTMSAINSRASTPRSGTLRSHNDIQFGSGVITGSYNMATGSRTLDRSCTGSFDRPTYERYGRSSSCERPDFDRSCPGSFDRHHNDDSDFFYHSPPLRSSMRTFQSYHDVEPDAAESSSAFTRKRNDMETNSRNNGLPTRVHRIDPSQFMLPRDDSCQYRPSQVISNEVRSLPRSPDHMQSNGLRHPDAYMSSTAPPHSRLQIAQSRHSHGHIFRQDRFDLTPGNSTELPSPPVMHRPPTSKDRVYRRGRLSIEQRGDTATTTATSKSTASGTSLTLTSSASLMSSQTDDSEDESKRRQQFGANVAYYAVKELVMTERTYKKDLEVITVKFQDALSRVDVMSDYLMQTLFGSIVPIYEFHCGLLKELDQRLAVWESSTAATTDGADGRKIGDVLLTNMTVLQWYRNYFDRLEDIMTQLDSSMHYQRDIQHAVTDFEAQKVCYLPLNSFYLKPYQRLLHYQLLLDKFLTMYGSDHLDRTDARACLGMVVGIAQSYSEKICHVQNWQKLFALQHDLSGIDNIMQCDRIFIREGCLQKLSRKGLQPRMFFLFSDVLVYSSRLPPPKMQFKVHCQLALCSVDIAEADAQTSSAVPFCFAITGSNRSMMVSASCQEEKMLWMEELQSAVRAAKHRGDTAESSVVLYPTLKSNSSSEAVEECLAENSPDSQSQLPLRANTTTQVCWHRMATIGMADMQAMLKNQLSGHLQRKFKNSNGWQKLWVVFANFCLFFYKNFQDDSPLASLPLLGYAVGIPTDQDGIRKNHVFKLQFRNHIYFFRADSEFSFARWVEVIGSATGIVAQTSNGADSSSPVTSTLPLLSQI